MEIKIKLKEITKKIIGASSEVPKFLGIGLLEVIYHRSLAWKFDQAGLAFSIEIEQLPAERARRLMYLSNQSI